VEKLQNEKAQKPASAANLPKTDSGQFSRDFLR
jgi:hypothetical protein